MDERVRLVKKTKKERKKERRKERWKEKRTNSVVVEWIGRRVAPAEWKPPERRVIGCGRLPTHSASGLIYRVFFRNSK